MSLCIIRINMALKRRRPTVLTGTDGVERKEFKVQEPDENLSYRVIATDFVTMEEGTGIVHVAPAFGEVDFEAGLENDLDFVQQVDFQGKIIGTYPLPVNSLKAPTR